MTRRLFEQHHVLDDFKIAPRAHDVRICEYRSIDEIAAATGTPLTKRTRPVLIQGGVADHWVGAAKARSVDTLCHHYGDISFNVGAEAQLTLTK